MANPRLFDSLDIALRDCVTHKSVRFDGAWSQSLRRTYQGEAQLGTGAGPFRDVTDLHWRGVLTSPDPISGICFLLTAGTLFWAKAPQISEELSVGVSLHAYSEYTAGRATFTANLAGAFLPAVPVGINGDFAETCTLTRDAVRTGSIARLAEAGSAAFFVLLFPRDVIKVGRKRLWRIRDEVAASLPVDLRELLTRRRTGVVRSD